MIWTPRAVTFFLACLLNLLLAGFIGWQYRKRRIARFYALSAFFAAGYSWLTGGLAAADSEGFALTWFRLFFPLTCFGVVTIFHFALIYSRLEKPWTLFILKASYAYAAVISLIRMAGLFPGRLVRHADLSWFPDHDPFYFNFYVPFFMGLFFLAFGLVLKRTLATRSAVEKNQLRFFLAALGSLFVITQFNLSDRVSFLGSFDMVSYSAILAYAVSRQRLFDLSLIVRRGAVAAALVFFLALAFVFSLVLLQVLFKDSSLAARLASALGVGVVITLLFQPLKSYFERHIQSALGLRHLGTTERILEYAAFFTHQQRLGDYLEALAQKLARDMGLQSVRILLKDRAAERYSVRAAFPAEFGREAVVDSEGALAGHLAGGPSFLDLEEMNSTFDFDGPGSLGADEKDQLGQALKGVLAEAAVPVKDDGRLEGILLLGPKISGAIFTNAEQSFLAALALELARNLENSRLSEQLQQADKLSLLGTMAASVAHEIRNPLTSVSLFVQMVAVKFDDEGFRKMFLNSVPQELQKLSRLTEELLAFSRPVTGVFSQVNANALCTRMGNLVRYQFLNRKVKLEVEPLSQADPFTLGDEARLSQVLLNLLLNALQASTAEGEVRLSVAWPEPQWVTLSVSDTGSGMTPAQSAQIFEPFYTTKSSGTGLGLATCQRVVTEHGGRILVKTEPGKGSVFTVKLPAAVNGALVQEPLAEK